MDVSETLPGLTDAERKYIREKASSDAIHLLAIQSNPPSQPINSPLSPIASHSPSVTTYSIPISREASISLLNAASQGLPDTLPTPPRRTHHEDSPPPARMKSTRYTQKHNTRPSATVGTNAIDLYAKLQDLQSTTSPFTTTNNTTHQAKNFDRSIPTLSLDLYLSLDAHDDKSPFDPDATHKITLDPATPTAAREGFVEPDTIGGGENLLQTYFV